MKLLYITNGTSAPGGLERVLSIKASYFADHMGYDVHIITLNDGGREQFYDFSPRITFHDIKCVGGAVRYFNEYRSGLKSVVSEIKPDIISVCDDGLKGFFVPLFLGGKPCPMIYERHASKMIQSGGEKMGLKQRIVARLMNIGGSMYDRLAVLTNYNISEWPLNNVVVMPNPLSFYPESLEGVEKRKVVLCVGSISHNKGQDQLIDAWIMIADRAKDWELHFYGKGDTTKLLGQVETLGLNSSVKFFPPTKDIDKVYKSSSIYALPSRSEGFGMVLIEAMACGVPCVSFDCPCGPRDIIKDGEDGYLVDNGDIESLANSLLKLIYDDKLRMTMGNKARDNVKRYRVEYITQQWDKLFNQLCK
ncbi:MAG: glycosyltransferase family 4 protein [Bacteroidales bacterium]